MTWIVTFMSVLLLLSPHARGEPLTNIDKLFTLSLEELLSIEVEVASGVLESELEVGSTVSLVTQEQWRQRGARRTDDALGGLVSTIALPTIGGSNALAVRGYATELSVRGIATILDGVPLNTLSFGTAVYDKPNINLGVLERIETIRGPGSAIYGSDAFHGVVSLKSFSSHTNLVSAEMDVGHQGYRQSNLKISQGFQHFRIHTAVAISTQDPQNRPYSYTDVDTQNTLRSSRDHQYESQSVVVKISDSQQKQGRFELGYYFNKWNADQSSGFGSLVYSGSSLGRDRDFSANRSHFQMLKGAYNWYFARQVSLQANVYYWQNSHDWDFDLTRSVGHTFFLGEQEYRNGLSLTLRQPFNDWNIQWQASLATNHLKVTDTHNQRIANDGTVLLDDAAPYHKLSRTIHSAFVQTKSHFFDKRLYLLLGARFDDYSDFGVQVSPRTGLIWKGTSTSAIKLLYGNAFRAGVGGELKGSGEIRGDPTIKPETIDTYELIYMHTQTQWKSSVTYFQSEWKNAIVIRPLINDSEGFSSEYVNRGENKASGVELEGQYLINQFNLQGGLSWVTSESVSENLDYVAFPEYIINLDVHFTALPETLTFSLFNRLHLNADSGPVRNNIQHPAPLEDYFRTDLSVSGKVNKQLDYFFHIRNIFDQNNQLPSIWNAEGGIGQPGININGGVKMVF